MVDENKKSKRYDSAARIMLALSAILVLMGMVVIDPMAGVSLAMFLWFSVVIVSKKYRLIALLLLLAVPVGIYALAFHFINIQVEMQGNSRYDATAKAEAKNFYGIAMAHFGDSDSRVLSFSRDNPPKDFNPNPDIEITGKLIVFLISKNEQAVSTMSFSHRKSRNVIKLDKDGFIERIEKAVITKEDQVAQDTAKNFCTASVAYLIDTGDKSVTSTGPSGFNPDLDVIITGGPIQFGGSKVTCITPMTFRHIASSTTYILQADGSLLPKAEWIAGP